MHTYPQEQDWENELQHLWRSWSPLVMLQYDAVSRVSYGARAPRSLSLSLSLSPSLSLSLKGTHGKNTYFSSERIN